MDRLLWCINFLTRIVLFLASFLAYAIIALLGFHTYTSAAGYTSYCSLATDIPGRLSIFFLGLYTAGVCGYFPLPDRWRLQCLPKSSGCCDTRNLAGTRRDRRLNARGTNAQGRASEHPSSRSGGREERETLRTNTSSYGATRGIPVAIPTNATRRVRRENVESPEADIRGNRTFGSQGYFSGPAHPQVAWSQIGASEMSSSPNRALGTPAVTEVKWGRHDSGCILPARHSARRKRCVTDPSLSDIYDTRTNAVRSPDGSTSTEGSYPALSSASDRSADHAPNINYQRIQHGHELASETSSVGETPERAQNSNNQRMLHIEEQSAASPRSSQFYMSL